MRGRWRVMDSGVVWTKSPPSAPRPGRVWAECNTISSEANISEGKKRLAQASQECAPRLRQNRLRCSGQRGAWAETIMRCGDSDNWLNLEGPRLTDNPKKPSAV